MITEILKYKLRIFLFLFIIVAVAIRVFFVFELPYGQKVEMKLEGLNDEPSHFNYVKFLAEYKTFPVQKMSTQDDSAFIKNEFEYYQPPLYYLICSPFAMFFENSTALVFCRLISLFFGLLTVYFIYKLILLLGFPPIFGLFAVTLTMYLLSPSYFSSICSNDSLSWLFPVLLLYLCYKFEKQEPNLKHLILISSVLTLSLLTKTSNLILIVFTLSVSLFDYFQGKKRKAYILIAAAIIASLLALPWYLRNLHIYNSLLAMEVGFGPVQKQTIPFGYHLYLMFRGAVGYFWFPMQHVTQSIGQRILTLIGILIVSIQTILYFRWSLKYSRAYNVFKVNFLLLLSILAYINLQLKWGNPEGRYLFTALFPIVLLFIAPYHKILCSRKFIWSIIILLTICFFPYLYFFLV